VGRTGTQSGGDLCGLCGQELLAPKSLAAGVCEKCHLDAQRLPAETKEVIA
jgi:hypothetical protein